VLSVTFAALGQSDERAAALSARAAHVHQATHVLDLSSLPLVIDQPGRYVLDRDWDIVEGVATVIDVRAADVIIDLRGHVISSQQVAISISGDRVTVRNGELGSGSTATVTSSGSGTLLENLEIGGYDGIFLHGPSSIVRDSSVDAREGSIMVFNAATIERNRIGCFFSCVRLAQGSRFTDNTVDTEFGDAVTVDGNDNFLARNTIIPGGGVPIIVNGSGNLLRDNTLSGVSSEQSALFQIVGSANVLDGNIAMADATAASRPPIGITFAGTGNFFGDNRLAAAQLCDGSGAAQTDWGGSVTF
jgi:hypothetical protein